MRFLPLVSAALALLVAAAPLGSARAETPLPEPNDRRSVYDTAGVIEAKHARAMEVLHRELFEQTDVGIVVLTVPELEGETIQQLATRAGHDWGVGGGEEDTGVLIALSKGDREIFVATGYGVEGYLPDGLVTDILNEHAFPHLREDRFSTGLFSASRAIAQVAAEEHEVSLDLSGAAGPTTPTQRPGPERRGEPDAGSIVMLIIGVIVFVYLAIKHPRLLLFIMMMAMMRGGGRGGGGFGGGGGGFGGFGGGGFGGGGAGGDF